MYTLQCFTYHLLAVLYRTVIFASACASLCLSRVVFQFVFGVRCAARRLNMRVCMRICRSFRVSYYIYVVYMSSTKVHLFSRVHAHLRARFVLSLYTCSRTSVCDVRICACTRAWEWSYVCNTRATYIHYRGRDEPQMRMHTLTCFQSTLGYRPAKYARVHAHLPFVSCYVLYICCVYVTYKCTSTFACACAFTRALRFIGLHATSYIRVWCAYMCMHTRVGVVICM